MPGCGCFRRKRNNELSGKASDYPLVISDDLKLVQLQVLFRHGARTPINFIKGLEMATYSESLGEDLPETMFNYEVVRFRDGAKADDSSLESDLVKIKLQGGCYAAMLTTVGQRQMFQLGERIRDAYIDKLGLRVYSKELIELRTTHLSRTIYSLRCTLAGIYGREHLNQVGPIKFSVKSILEEDLFPNKLTCPTLRLATDIALLRLCGVLSFKQDKDVLLKALKLPPNESVDFAALRDEIVCRTAHGMPIPSALVPHMQCIEENAARTLYAVYTGKISATDKRATESEFSVTKLAIGRLIHTILLQMEKCIYENEIVKMCLYSAHDTSLTPMMEALGIWEMVWPPFAADISFELYRRDKDSQFFVRMLYCGEPRAVQESGFLVLPFNEFRKSLHKYRLPPFAYAKHCLAPYTV